MLSKTLRKIRGSKTGYNFGRKILSNPFIVDSKIYDKYYNKKIRKTINSLEKKFPLGVDIGTTNLCNAACIMCPHSKLKKMGTMDMKLYKKIIDNCARLNIKLITLSFFGEPFLDKNIIEKIKYAKEKKMYVGLYSNASLLNKDLSKKIIESGLDGITISFDGYSKETYEKIRKNLKFEITKRNVLELINIKNKMKRLNPKITLVLVELEENKKEIGNFYKEWKEKVDSINIINMRNWANDIQKEGTKESFHFNKKIKRKPCALIWLKMIVDWNGDVVLCCDDWNHSIILGNLKKQTIEEIWEGDKLKKIRESHKKGEFYNVPLCAGCNKKTIWWMID
ncbi:MAG TPA: radical SAM/SPASM domain-containing protein [Candidatus Pacearchaeota archaeon]|nr:radical SAM/SPASM domain-containing protein [Candidatus Pacearchaeota archaeon]